jgi:predicted metal-binding protein
MEQANIDTLIQHALSLGVSDAKVIAGEKISVEDQLAALCKEQRCNSYGQSANCPPHVMRPDQFRELLKQYQHALVFKFDVPLEILISPERLEITRMLHEIVAGIERFALEDGYTKVQGLAGGSCKRLFCDEYDTCSVLTGEGDCRFPAVARPSIAGVGINFFALSKALGWQIAKITTDTTPDDTPMGLLAGMVLLG